MRAVQPPDGPFVADALAAVGSVLPGITDPEATSSTMNANASSPLEYAVGEPVRRRRRRRRVVWGLLGVLVVAVWWLAGPAAYRWVRFCYCWNLCLSHRLSQGRVVYDDDPVAEPTLLAADPTLRQVGPSLAYEVGPSVSVPAVAHVSPAYEYVLGGPRPPTPLAFLHGRRTPKGGRWLVALSPRVIRFSTFRQFYFHFECQQARRGSASDGQPLAIMSHLNPPDPNSDPEDYPHVPLRLYAGQADPADESHFTVRYRVGDVTGTIHGWLEDDDDGKAAKVRFEARADGAGDTEPSLQSGDFAAESEGGQNIRSR
jgi:hypothetical protein